MMGGVLDRDLWVNGWVVVVVGAGVSAFELVVIERNGWTF